MREDSIVLLFYWLLILGILLLALGIGAYITDKLPEEKLYKLERKIGGRG